MGVRFPRGDEPELLEVVVAMFEMRSMPLFRYKGAEDGVRLHSLRVITAERDEASDFLK